MLYHIILYNLYNCITLYHYHVILYMLHVSQSTLELIACLHRGPLDRSWKYFCCSQPV